MSPSDYPSITRMFGIEMEFFLLDRFGGISNNADLILDSLKDKLVESRITNECGQHMIESISFPHRSSREVYRGFFNDMENILYESDVNDLRIFQYGTYPGINTGKTRTEPRYKINEKIRGQGMKVANSCIGFHFHYSMPRNVFNKNIQFFYPDINNRKKQKIKNLFNLFVAFDPAVSTLMQSSPFYEGKYLGKSSRMIIYRSDSIFNAPVSLYKDYPQFSKLNEYADSYDQLIKRTIQRSKEWRKLLADKEVNLSDYSKKDRQASILDSSWKPVKITTHSTIESRGADMNDMNKIVSMSTIMAFIAKYIQNNFVEVVPGETGNEEPFKLEDKTLYVPEFSRLKDELQLNSAYEGLDNDDVYKYAKSFIKLAKDLTKAEASAPIKTFSEMLMKKKTKADEIIDFVRKKQGYIEEVSEETAKEFALKSAEGIYKDVFKAKKMCEKHLFYI